MSRLTPESLDSRNQILTSIDDEQLDLLLGHLEPVDLDAGHILFNAGDRIDHVYFPHDSMHSVVALTADGQTVESGIVGFEGEEFHDCILALFGLREEVPRPVSSQIP